MVIYPKLLRCRSRIEPSKGAATEITGILLKIANPRARLSRTETRSTLFTCLGEFMWYLAGSNNLEFIAYYIPNYGKYSDDKKTIYGGYGPRLFGKNKYAQFDRIINILRTKQDSRQAVIQLFDSNDIVESHRDIPCTCTIQLFLRKGKLDMLVNMRSNDAYMGLPHDIFCFTLFQEIIARAVHAELGIYKHAVGSLHLYDENRLAAEKYIAEGWQESISMDIMPFGDPLPSMRKVRQAERLIRVGEDIDARAFGLDSYWADLIRILQIFKYTKHDGSLTKASAIKRQMVSKIYSPYIAKRHNYRLQKETPVQRELFSNDGD